MAMEPAEEETSEDVEDERERNSKIRARHHMRNELIYTYIMADTHASATREQEVVRRKVGQKSRHYPVS